MASFKIIVDAGNHERRFCPVHVDIKHPKAGKEVSATLTEVESGRTIPNQLDTLGEDVIRVHWIIDNMRRNSKREYTLRIEGAPPETTQGEPSVDLKEEREGVIGFYTNGKLFTRYHYGEDVIRPYLHPVLGPRGVTVTRNYPMIPDLPDEVKDHPHHRSIWTAHGDVNGVDDWTEFPTCGRIVHRGFRRLVGGPVYGEAHALNDWVSREGVKVVGEERRLTVYNTPEYARIMDFEILFKATEGDVTFGDTKEGGILSVRVASSMDVVRGGRIENSYGGINEEETWGRRAHWCDYSGPVKGIWAGIAVFDHPENLRHPTYWHVRNYGLMTANPFGISYFTGGPKNIGNYTLKAGGTLRFRYRILIHEGDVEAGGVREAYHNYVNPPKVIIELISKLSSI